MVIAQMIAFERIIRGLWDFRTGEWHDGDCVGADTQAHDMVENYNKWRKTRDEDHIVMHGHPCNLTRYRGYNEYHHTYPIQPPLVRNRVMVDFANVLIATPMEYEEKFKGSGTWATIRYAALKTMHVPTFIIFPDGEVEVRNVWERS